MRRVAVPLAALLLLLTPPARSSDRSQAPLGLGGLDGEGAPAVAAAPEPGPELFNSIYQALQEKGIPKDFIEELSHDPALQFDEKFIHSNLLNFLEKENYRFFLSKHSVKNCKAFLQNNMNSLKSCEAKFGVPKEVITALLWVETKHGRDLGRHHVTSVFMNLALSEQREILDRALKQAHERRPASGKSSDELNARVRAVAKRKAAWATEQLLALAEMHQRNGIDVRTLKGSYSGAFGIPQFIPTSFLQWAADGDGDGKIDLFKPADAICSVANYLKTNGWAKSASSHRQAVFHYNHSTEYGSAVLTLAKKLKHDSRLTARE